MESKDRKRERMSKLITGWYRSDLTVKAYCARHGISTARFYYWKGRLPQVKEPPAFVTLQVSPPVAEAQTAYLRLPNGVELHGLPVDRLLELGLSISPFDA